MFAELIENLAKDILSVCAFVATKLQTMKEESAFSVCEEVIEILVKDTTSLFLCEVFYYMLFDVTKFQTETEESV